MDSGMDTDTRRVTGMDTDTRRDTGAQGYKSQVDLGVVKQQADQGVNLGMVMKLAALEIAGMNQAVHGLRMDKVDQMVKAHQVDQAV